MIPISSTQWGIRREQLDLCIPRNMMFLTIELLRVDVKQWGMNVNWTPVSGISADLMWYSEITHRVLDFARTKKRLHWPLWVYEPLITAGSGQDHTHICDVALCYLATLQLQRLWKRHVCSDPLAWQAGLLDWVYLVFKHLWKMYWLNITSTSLLVHDEVTNKEFSR